MKTDEVVAYSFNGDIFDVKHKPTGQNSDGDEAKPIFASDDFDMKTECAKCHKEIGSTEHWFYK